MNPALSAIIATVLVRFALHPPSWDWNLRHLYCQVAFHVYGRGMQYMAEIRQSDPSVKSVKYISDKKILIVLLPVRLR